MRKASSAQKQRGKQIHQILNQQDGSWQQSENRDRPRRTPTATASAGDPSSGQRTGTDNCTTPKSEPVIVTPKQKPTTPSGTYAGRRNGYPYGTRKEVLTTGNLVGADQGVKTIKHWRPVPGCSVLATDTGEIHPRKTRKPCSLWHAPGTTQGSTGRNHNKAWHQITPPQTGNLREDTDLNSTV